MNNPLPLENRLPTTYPIISRRQETDQVQTFTFNASFNSRPGQFLMVWLPGYDEVPMSIAMDDGKQISITFFAVGDTTKHLAQLQEGDLVGLRGAFGTWYEWQPKQHLILVAGGYGAAPMYFTAKEAVKDECIIDFVVGARSKEHLLYLEEIHSLQNTTLHIATDDGSEGHKGYNTEILETILQQAQDDTTKTTVFACGPEMMMKRISDICYEKKVLCFMSIERYMKCGFGLCGNCAVDPLGIRVCQKGPVMSNELIRQIDEFGQYHRDAEGKKQPL